MKVGLVDMDSKNGNLALAKIAGFYKKNGHYAELCLPGENYDKLYFSKIFSWSPEQEPLCAGAEKIYGGSGYESSAELPEDVEHSKPDYSLYGWEYSLGFTTRGCPRKCWFCQVPKKEGAIRAHAEIEEFCDSKFRKVVLLDNNILAHEHGIRQLEKIAKAGMKLDCNQGIDARLIDSAVANLLAKIKWIPAVRLACDSLSDLPRLLRTVEILRSAGVTPRRYLVYLLVTDNIDSALERAVRLREAKLDVFAQPFRDRSGAPVPQAQADFARWVNHKAIFKSVPFSEYRRSA